MSDASPALDPASLGAVHLLGLPVALWSQAQEHSDELLREFTLIAQQLHDGDGHREVPGRLVRLVQALTARYGSLTAHQDAELAAAVASGRAVIDRLTFQVPPEAADDATQLGALLDEADDYCRSGRHLLTLATPAELVRFRHWYLDQFIHQLGGQAPAPWCDYPG